MCSALLCRSLVKASPSLEFLEINADSRSCQAVLDNLQTELLDSNRTIGLRVPGT